MTNFERDEELNVESQVSSQQSIFLIVLFAGVLVSIILGGVLLTKLNKRQPTPVPVAAVNAPASGAMPVAAGSIMWESSYEGALESARQSGKPVMIDFYTDWCGVCKDMESNTLPAPEVVAESQNYVNVRVNAEQRAEVARLYGVNAYPTYVFLDSNGNVRNTFAGGRAPADFAQLMRSSR